MEGKKEKRIVGTMSLKDALDAFANISKENSELLKRIEKINELINTIVDERELLGLSQRDLADLTGIKQPMIARFEKAEMMPRIDTFIKIASCLNLDLELVRMSDYSNLELNQKFSYDNEYIGEEVYGFTKTKKHEYKPQICC